MAMHKITILTSVITQFCDIMSEDSVLAVERPHKNLKLNSSGFVIFLY